MMDRVLFRAAMAVLAASLAACSSVTMPEEIFYRLESPDMPAMPVRSPAVVRVEGLELAATLSADRLLVEGNAVQLRAYEFHRWIGPLPRLVQDAVQLGLTRAGAFREVKSPMDGPGESLVLSGRILDFHQVGRDGAWFGKVGLELRLADADTGAVLFQQEFTQTVPASSGDPADVVLALSRGTRMVLAQLLERCGEAGVFDGVAPPAK